MIKFDLAKSRSYALNIMIREGLEKVRRGVEAWDKTYAKAEKMKKDKIRIRLT